ncbi:SIMPL domain-containing protein [Crossiella cryophila]|uniref:SIMPL domain-containing protein n=1 Tax=Crossiella cryophila TaxID=43355 RepID=UPI00160C6453|nr:SIMPL domain-containing protein [Crossiella cryophila]
MAEVVTKGTGEVERTADRAQLWVSFTASAGDRTEAVTLLGQRVAGVEPLLEQDGVEVRSRRLSVQPNWQGDRQIGANAEQHYQLRVADRATLERVVAALVAAEPAALNGPDWELSEQAEAAREAQVLAVADARRRAEGYASALGVRLGPLLRISDGEDAHYAPMARAGGYAMAAEVSPAVQALNLEPQAITVGARCTTTWSLLD